MYMYMYMYFVTSVVDTNSYGNKAHVQVHVLDRHFVLPNFSFKALQTTSLMLKNVDGRCTLLSYYHFHYGNMFGVVAVGAFVITVVTVS